MDGFKEFLTIVGAIVGLVVVIATVVAYINRSKFQATLEALEATIRTQEVDKASLRSNLSDAHLELNESHIENEGLRRENTTLKEQRPSQELIKDMAEKLNKHHESTMRLLGVINDGIK